jgi:hypothetical protein
MTAPEPGPGTAVRTADHQLITGGEPLAIGPAL